MRPEQVRALYDAEYAATYDARFLTAAEVAPDTAFELQLLQDLTRGAPGWIDVACGTGYFLRQFQNLHRVGVDLSPAMLERARQGNPGVAFFEHDFRHARPEWNDRFGLVSCMWYAYTLVDTVAEVNEVIRNLASWTSPSGTCFVPLADARMITGCDLPHLIQNPAGEITISAVVWSFTEPGGSKMHVHLVTPQMELMI